jgi:hypothetical protein
MRNLAAGSTTGPALGQIQFPINQPKLPRYPTGQRGLVDPQILRDLGDGVAGLGDDPYGPLAELRIELPLCGRAR